VVNSGSAYSVCVCVCVCVRACVCVTLMYTVFGEKGATRFCLKICQMLADFQNPFTDRLSREFLA